MFKYYVMLCNGLFKSFQGLLMTNILSILITICGYLLCYVLNIFSLCDIKDVHLNLCNYLLMIKLLFQI